jgi:aspartate/methionine/tyrosine aminotransferase
METDMFISRKVTEHTRSTSQVEIVSYLSNLKKRSGEELIDLSIGNPDLPPCDEALEILRESINIKGIHGYGNLEGLPELKHQISEYYRTRYHVDIRPDEIVIVRGIRTMIFSLTSLFTGPGDIVLIPNVAYPSYFLATEFSGASQYLVPMNEDQGFIPDLDLVPEEILAQAKMLFLNYPNNPTGAVIKKAQLEKIVKIAKQYSILIVYDNAYNEIVFDDETPLSFMEIEGAKDVGIELFSLSKLTSLAGWRISFCTAGKEIISTIYEYLSLTETAPFNGFQFAAAKAIEMVSKHNLGHTIAMRYKDRYDSLSKVLEKIGLSYYPSKGSFYVWIRSPKGTGRDFADFLVEEAKLLVVPGEYYGPGGLEYVRISLTMPDNLFDVFLKRLESMQFSWDQAQITENH